MRILHWVRVGNKLGGFERYTILLARECQRRGHELTVMHDVPNTVREYHESLEGAGARYMESGNSWEAPVRSTRTVAVLLREWRPSVVHAHFINPLMLPALRVLGKSLVYATFHSGIDRKITPRIRLVCKLHEVFAHRLFAVSERVRRDSILAGVNPVRIATLYLGLDLEGIRAASDQCSDPIPEGFGDPRLRRVISVAQFQPVKGMVTVTEAAISVLRRMPDVVWWLVGADGPDMPMAKALVRNAGLADRVLFLGQRNDVPALMKRSCLQVVGSRSEGLPLMIVEAAALGVPTVGPNIGGVDEAVLDGETGILVDRPTGERLAEAAERLLCDDATRELMSNRAAAFAREAFDANVHIGKLLDTYEHDADTTPNTRPIWRTIGFTTVARHRAATQQPDVDRLRRRGLNRSSQER
ncbi:MAG TPA: glycosyltransferase [bacterium]|nr:glycosyltransferase [bacterium]